MPASPSAAYRRATRSLRTFGLSSNSSVQARTPKFNALSPSPRNNTAGAGSAATFGVSRVARSSTRIASAASVP